jgi:hypothetical protein
LTTQPSNAIFSALEGFSFMVYVKGMVGGASLLILAFMSQVAYQLIKPKPQVGITTNVIAGTLPVSVALTVALFAVGFALAARYW